MHEIARRIKVALGETPADLVVAGADVFNVFTGEFAPGNVLIADGHIAAVLPPDTPVEAEAVLDAGGSLLVPGFIDAHVHIESSMVRPEEFAAFAASRGVTTIIADPHEIANVLGVKGIRYMLEATEEAAARVLFMLPSCVPASSLEQAAQTLSASDLASFLGHPRVLGLGEMMNYPSVLARDPGVLGKIAMVRQYTGAAFGALRGLALDGHSPQVSGRALQAYIGAGIMSDHETSTVAEASERLANGMGVLLREGSAARNLLDLVPAVTPSTAHLCALCTDDRQPVDLAREGSINFLVKKLVDDGRLPLPDILRMASWNAARLYSLRETGAIAPGYRADLALFPDRESWIPSHVLLRGGLVARGGAPVRRRPSPVPEFLRGTVALGGNFGAGSLRIADRGKPVKVIGVVPDQILTEKRVMRLPASDGLLLADAGLDVAKLAVVERHRGTGRVGLGFVKGMGLRRGALASSIAHDSHNLVVLGMDDASMVAAALALREAGGGFAVADEGRVLRVLPLPLAGLFAEEALTDVAAGLRELRAAVRPLGLGEEHDPFMTLSFLSLAVIPRLKLTDGGLVDVDAFSLTTLYAEEGEEA